MKIRSLEIRNFRGISALCLNSIKDMIIIAGPNGCGKSCVLDAIRLLKSIYGGYQPNEVHQWLGEFQINFSQDAEAFTGLMQNKSLPLLLSAKFEVQDDEIAFLKKNSDSLLREILWKLAAPEMQGWSTINSAPFAAQMRSKQPEVEAQLIIAKTQLLQEIEENLIEARILIDPISGKIEIKHSKMLEIIFSTYRPNDIGVIEYNGAKRHYERETVQGINLNIDTNNQNQRSHHALYNYSAKYSNIKSEMASLYVKEALALRAGLTPQKNNSLTLTLQELFRQFFPDKEFLGPIATKDGSLKFPVRTLSGAEHDLNELSSGEKEILFGYLRLRNSAPKNSIIMLDEPELHLNPRLLIGLPSFYYKNLGQSLNNQLWLITHSDTLLRESVGKANYSVFHMSPANPEGTDQAKEISLNEELDQAIIDLVGDLATYKPGAKLLILEGENSEFDKKMLSALFPKFATEVNIISGGNKSAVKRLKNALSKALHEGGIPMKVFSITDADLDENSNQELNSWQWDVYHIENYLINPEIILSVMKDFRPGTSLPSKEELTHQLKECAKECSQPLIRHLLEAEANKQLIDQINTKTDPHSASASSTLYTALTNSKKRIDSLLQNELTIEKLKAKEAALSEEFKSHFLNEEWITKHRGRDILKKFCGKYINEMKYEIFRNLILSKMSAMGYQPSGMEKILKLILDPK